MISYEIRIRKDEDKTGWFGIKAYRFEADSKGCAIGTARAVSSIFGSEVRLNEAGSLQGEYIRAVF
jgi:hypothetical protein